MNNSSQPSALSQQLTRRYPGVKPFETAERDLFFGRDRDIEDLLDLIWLEKLVVLFGKSGYGKSSLINAGILPEIQNEAMPIVVRLGSYIEGQTRTPLDTLRTKIDEVLQDNPEANFLNNLPIPKTLWQQMKRKQSSKQRRFVLIFDQFEEFFTYPFAEQQAFKEQFADLLYTEVPQTVRNLTEKLSDTQQAFIASPYDAKVLFAIRSDRMSLLDSMKDKLPAILQKRYELKGLSDKQARDAITKPAKIISNQFITPPFEYTTKAIEKILAELSDNKNKAIEAFQVQIVCEEIEKEVEKGGIPDRDNNGLPDVDVENLPDFDNLYVNYYRRKLEEIAPSVQTAARLLIEDELIFEDAKTGEARRLSVDAGVLINKTGVNQAMLNQLESTFLLRREANAMGSFNYEVSHDTMIAPILKLKAERKAKEKEELEQLEAQRKQRRLIATLVAAIIALAIVIGVVLYVLKLRNDALAALETAKQEKTKAEKALNDYEQAQKDKELTQFRITIQNIRSILKGGNCPQRETLQSIKDMQSKYSKDNDLQKEINQILSELSNCK